MKSFDDLYALVKHLRIHCPWDREQGFDSMSSCVSEEIDELCEAIKKKDWDNVKEEIGDSLFNLLFICNLAELSDRFTLDEVLQESHQKMVLRHPHVFGDVKAATPQEALEAFLKAKKMEKKNKELDS